MPWQKEAQELIAHRWRTSSSAKARRCHRDTCRSRRSSQTGTDDRPVSRVDDEAQAPCAARSALLARGRRRAPREDEPQVAVPLRQRHEQRVRLGRDPHVLDARHRPRRLHAVDPAKTPRRGIGIIITPTPRLARYARAPRRARGAAAPPRATRRRPSRRGTAAPGAEAADGARRHFEHVHAASFTRHSAWTGPGAGRARRPPPPPPSTIRACTSAGGARRRDVNRLLEERAVERVRLVEDRERLESAARQHALDRVLGAGNAPACPLLVDEPE